VSDNAYFLEECMKEVVSEVNKRVRDSILLGKAQLSKTQTTIDQNEIEEHQLNINKQYLTYKIKEFKLNHTMEKKKHLQKSLQDLDQKITQIKSHGEPKYEIDIRRPRDTNYSPLRKPIGKIPKMSDDYERKKKESEAKEFIKKLNKEKLERINEERKRVNNNNKFILIEESNNNANNNSHTKVYVVLPQISYKINQQSSVNNQSRQDSVEKYNKHLLPNNNIHKEDLQKNLKNSNDFTFKRNGEQIIQSDGAIKSSVKSSGDFNKVPKVEESLFNDQSMSFKSNKKSPYYFNDPKYNKILEIKQKYSHAMKHSIPRSEVDDIKYISDQNNISEEEYEILKNLH